MVWCRCWQVPDRWVVPLGEVEQVAEHLEMCHRQPRLKSKIDSKKFLPALRRVKKVFKGREPWSWSYKQNLSVNLCYAHFRPLLLVEILDQPIRMLKNEHSIILCLKYLYRAWPRPSGYGWWLMFNRLWVWILALHTGWTFGHFSHWFVVKIVCLKRPKINKKSGRVGPFKEVKKIFKSYSIINHCDRINDLVWYESRLIIKSSNA